MQIPLTYEDVSNLQLFFYGLAFNFKVNCKAELTVNSWLYIKDLVAFREVYDFINDLDDDLASSLFIYLRNSNQKHIPSQLNERQLVEYVPLAVQPAMDYFEGSTWIFNNQYFKEGHIEAYFKTINFLIKEITAEYTPIEYIKICNQSYSLN